jgi:methylisocitrate lyase
MKVKRMRNSTILRKLLKKPGLLVVPGVYDCLTAGCAEEVGFKALFMCTAGIRSTEFGIAPAIITQTEVVTSLRNMMNSIHVPLVFDAEVGFGGALDAYRTAQELIRIGIAGISMNDQKHPYKGPSQGHNPKSILKEVISRDEYLGKMGAVLEARNKMDKDVVIVARIEAASTMGDEEAIERAKACLKLGVDVILPQARLPQSKFGVRSKEEIKELYKAIGAPDVPIWAIGVHGIAASFGVKEWEGVGAKIWAPGPLNAAVTKLVLGLLQTLHEKGTIEGYNPPGGPTPQFFSKLAETDFWENMEKKYVP